MYYQFYILLKVFSTTKLTPVETKKTTEAAKKTTEKTKKTTQKTTTEKKTQTTRAPVVIIDLWPNKPDNQGKVLSNVIICRTQLF